LPLAAWRGRETDAAALIDSSLNETMARGEGMGWTLIHNAAAVLYNGLGRYERAFEAAARASKHPTELGFATLVLPELVEAAVRCGKLYRDAVEHLACTRMHIETARTHLLHGEWLRRTGRRLEARQQLRTAHAMFSAMGAEAFAERARRELLATGETARRRAADTLDALTPQEAQIARLAVEGQTNPQIGTALFISPRTVEHHLRKVFQKLDVSSLTELRDALPRPRAAAAV
jgi:DNA-binding CsgD family transcriptional regulator